MSSRKLQALRNLAERPGTEAEGIVAREKLRQYESANPTVHDVYAKFHTFLRTGSMDDLSDAIGPKVCDCGASGPRFVACMNRAEHQRIADLICQKFPVGSRVYYNKWAYEMNAPATVSGYPRKEDSWNWLRLKFDRNKTVRSVPVYRRGIWYLFTQPVDAETLRQTGIREGMEDFEYSEAQ